VGILLNYWKTSWFIWLRITVISNYDKFETKANNLFQVSSIFINFLFLKLNLNTTIPRTISDFFELFWWLLCSRIFNLVNYSQGPCQGGYGGPLIVNHEDGRETLEGIISGGFSCRQNIPHWYTRVIWRSN
jgi:hypothetical protein